MDKKEMLYKMLLIRGMEQKIESMFSQGLLRGTTHCCIGQEGVPAVLSDLIDIGKDYLCSGHRAHGLSIMMTGKPELLLGEIMGKKFGMAKGLGGSQHVFYKNYFTNGITGGMVPVTAGIGFALKQENTNAIATVVFGDGAMNEGYVLESLNLISSLKLPVLLILENNGYAMSTPVDSVNPYSTFEERVKGFRLPYTLVSSDNFDLMYDVIRNGVELVRISREPQFIEVLTHRFCGHSKSDRRAYIPKEQDDYWHEHDILRNVSQDMPFSVVQEIENRAQARVEECFLYCMNN